MLAYDRNFTSSNIHGLAWANGIGYVEFAGGRRFGYSMPKTLFDEMRNAKSIGSFFARNVKGKCSVVSVTIGCNNSPCQADAALQGEIAGGKVHVCTACSKIPRMAQVVFTPIPESR